MNTQNIVKAAVVIQTVNVVAFAALKLYCNYKLRQLNATTARLDRKMAFAPSKKIFDVPAPTN